MRIHARAPGGRPPPWPRTGARSGICSSSTASATTPFAPTSSASRMRAACIRADAAALNDASSCWDMRCRIARNSPPPKSARMDRKTPTYHAVSRSRRRASECISAGSRPEAIARAARRPDQLRLEAVVDLAPQPPDQHLEQVGKRIMVVVPYVSGDGAAIEHPSLVQHEQLQQGELLRAERDRPATTLHLAAAEIDLEVRNPVSGRRQRGPAPREGLEARQELPKREGFGEIIVRPGLEPPHAVVEGIECRQHQHRGRAAPAPQLPAEIEAGASGESNVQDDHVERAPVRTVDVIILDVRLPGG